jgi:hypothetical protein
MAVPKRKPGGPYYLHTLMFRGLFRGLPLAGNHHRSPATNGLQESTLLNEQSFGSV